MIAALAFRGQIEEGTKRREEFSLPWETRAPLGFAVATLSVFVLAGFLPLSLSLSFSLSLSAAAVSLSRLG